MMNYKTVLEKAVEWNISSRQLQNLCKNGSIEGAVKKSRIWLIPDDAPIPLQHSRKGADRFRFVGTKRKIFDCAIELFRVNSYEIVGMKDIADAVGITQSSMYNHFESKLKILDTMYDFYCYYFHNNLPAPKDVEPVLRDGSLVDILKSTTFTYHIEYAKQMSGIETIIFYRCAIDSRAREIMQSLMIDEGVRVAKSILDRAVEIGRLAPMDTYAVAMLVNSFKFYSLHSWMADPSPGATAKVKEDEISLYRHAVKFLTDLKHPSRD